MRFFKHMTNAHRDPKLVALREREGLEGLARWWLLVELIAEDMNESDRCEINVSPGFLTRYLGFRSSTDCQSFVNRLANDQLLISNQSATYWLVSCPNLLKIRARKKPIGNKTSIQIQMEDIDGRNRSLVQPVFTGVDIPVDKPKIQPNKAGDTWLGITPDKFQFWKSTFPALDIQQELSKMLAWISANPKYKKKNYERFIVNWLTSNQDRARPNSFQNGSGSTNDAAADEWSKIMEHIRRKGTSVKLEGLSERGMKALFKIGGMSYLGQARSDQMPFIQKDFKNAWLSS